MSYELRKPITDIQKADFIVEYNHKQGLKIEDTEYFLFALLPDEIMGEKEIEIEVTDYDEEGNPIMIEYKDTKTVIDYDEEGNPVGSHEIIVIKHKQKTHTETITVPYPIINPNYEQEQAEKREQAFKQAFFITSLGYVRRSVTMADGSKKDFLSDLLPVISMGVQSGTQVHILTYEEPPFDKDITDWTEYQKQVTVTPQFIQECFLQLSNDFLPINED